MNNQALVIAALACALLPATVWCGSPPKLQGTNTTPWGTPQDGATPASSVHQSGKTTGADNTQGAGKSPTSNGGNGGGKPVDAAGNDVESNAAPDTSNQAAPAGPQPQTAADAEAIRKELARDTGSSKEEPPKALDPVDTANKAAAANNPGGNPGAPGANNGPTPSATNHYGHTSNDKNKGGGKAEDSAPSQGKEASGNSRQTGNSQQAGGSQQTNNGKNKDGGKANESTPNPGQEAGGNSQRAGNSGKGGGLGNSHGGGATGGNSANGNDNTKGYDWLTKQDEAMAPRSPPGAPALPSMCMEDADCRECFNKARAGMDKTRLNLEKVRGIYNYTHKFTTAGIAFMQGVANQAGGAAALGAQVEAVKVNDAVDGFDQKVAAKNLELLEKLKVNLQEVAACEAKHYKNNDWFDRYGFTYYQFMQANYGYVEAAGQ